MMVLGDVSFFWKKRRFLSFFQLLGGDLSYFGGESPTDCKNAFFLSRETLSRRLFLFWKKINNLVFSLKKWAEPFKKHITMNFWQKLSARLSQLDFTLPEGLFADFFPGKESIAKRFSQLERKFVMFCRKNSAEAWKVHHWVQMSLLKKNMFFLGEIMVYKCFPVGERKNVGLWQKKNQQHCQVCVIICLNNLFQEEKFSWKTQTFC